MESVLNYFDYRKFIQDYYDYRKRSSAFSWRDFAKEVQFSSPIFLNYVCLGKKNLSPNMAEQVAHGMNLFGYEAKYFVLLVRYAHEKEETKKTKIYQELLNLSKIHKVQMLTSNEWEYFSSWKYQALREVAQAMPMATPKEMGEALNPKLKPKEVARILNYLKRQKFLVEKPKGIYRQTNKSVKLDINEVQNFEKNSLIQEASKNLQKEMVELSLNAFDMPKDKRFLGGITMGIPQKIYPILIDEIRKFRHRIKTLVADTDETEQVYRLNFQLFPLSETLPNNKLDSHGHPERSTSLPFKEAYKLERQERAQNEKELKKSKIKSLKTKFLKRRKK